MKVILDNPKTLKMKNDMMALSFSVVFTDDEGGLLFVLSNFRLMDGAIHPPAIFASKARQYYPVAYLSPSLASKIYEQVDVNSWSARYSLPPLKSLAQATAPILLNTASAARVAPGIV